MVTVINDSYIHNCMHRYMFDDINDAGRVFKAVVIGTAKVLYVQNNHVYSGITDMDSGTMNLRDILRKHIAVNLV